MPNRIDYRSARGGLMGALRCCAFISLILGGWTASAEDFYALLSAGASFSNKVKGDLSGLSTGPGGGFGNDLSSSGVYGIGAGVTLPHDLRTDIRVTYRDQFHAHGGETDPTTGLFFSADSGKSSNWTVLANLYYDIPLEVIFRPYVGGGVGWARNRLASITYQVNGAISGVEAANTSNDFAWAVMVGLSYPMADRVIVDLGYRYLKAGDYRSSGTVTDTQGVVSSYGSVKSALTSNEIEFSVHVLF